MRTVGERLKMVRMVSLLLPTEKLQRELEGYKRRKEIIGKHDREEKGYYTGCIFFTERELKKRG